MTAPVLAPRELQLLEAFAGGHSVTSHAAAIFCTRNTVKTTARRLYEKLGANGAAHAVAIGYRTGVLS